MRVLFHTYDWAFQRPGGGEVQLLQTERYLRELGVTVDRFDRWSTRLEEYPLVHSFSLIPWEFWGPVRLAGCRLAVSSIHWPYQDQSRREKLKRTVRRSLGKALGETEAPVKPFQQVDRFFPNSQREADLMCQVYSLPPAQMHVVPNGVEERFADATPDAFQQEYGLRDFLLCVGRIDGRKNQLAMIQALRGIDRPLVFIGEPVLGTQEYHAACVEAGKQHTAGVHWLGKIPHDSPMLASAYAAAAALVLPSYIETPGLCALEAGLTGTPLVVTEQGCTREYFGEQALYVDPRSQDSIRAGVEQVLAGPPDAAALKQRIATRYLWRHAAEATLAGYEAILNSGAGRAAT